MYDYTVYARHNKVMECEMLAMYCNSCVISGVGVEAVTSELKDESVWFKLCLLQRVLCSAAGRCLFNMYKEETVSL